MRSSQASAAEIEATGFTPILLQTRGRRLERAVPHQHRLRLAVDGHVQAVLGAIVHDCIQLQGTGELASRSLRARRPTGTRSRGPAASAGSGAAWYHRRVAGRVVMNRTSQRRSRAVSAMRAMMPGSSLRQSASRSFRSRSTCSHSDSAAASSVAASARSAQLPGAAGVARRLRTPHLIPAPGSRAARRRRTDARPRRRSTGVHVGDRAVHVECDAEAARRHAGAVSSQWPARRRRGRTIARMSRRCAIDSALLTAVRRCDPPSRPFEYHDAERAQLVDDPSLAACAPARDAVGRLAWRHVAEAFRLPRRIVEQQLDVFEQELPRSSSVTMRGGRPFERSRACARIHGLRRTPRPTNTPLTPAPSFATMWSGSMQSPDPKTGMRDRSSPLR